MTSTLSNFELQKLAKIEGIKINAIVYKDNLKDLEPKTGYYIINLQDNVENTGGTHWTLLIIKTNFCFYYDPFGVLPTPDVIDFCKRIQNVRLAYSRQIMQNIKSSTCGFYVLAVMIYLKNVKTNQLYKKMNNYFRLYFEDNTKKNDKNLAKFFKKYSKQPDYSIYKQKLYEKVNSVR